MNSNSSQSWLRGRSLKTKLNIVVIGPMIAVVLLVLIGASLTQAERRRTETVVAVRAILRALAEDFLAIELLRDPSVRSNMAVRLQAFPEIEYLVVFGRHGERIYDYARPDLEPVEVRPPSPRPVVFSANRLHLREPLMGRTGHSGSLYVQADATAVAAGLRRDLRWILLLGVGLLVFTGIASRTVHALVSSPIADLVGLLEQAAGEKDYSLRIAVRSHDEIGYLASGLNDLLARTQIDFDDKKRRVEERERLIAELEAKNAELERFTYTVSHDLKSPLVTIRGFAGLLRQNAEAGKLDLVLADIGRIGTAAEKMWSLLEDLLELSRIGRIAHPSQEIDLDDLSREVVQLLDGQLSRRRARVAISSEMPRVFGDRQRLAEVLQNLIENAVKFTDAETDPRIEINAERRDREVICQVRDNGRGIDPRYHDKIFGLFERLDSRVEGTGIGLALVKRIIEVHGGRIWVESANGTGSTFCFTLPPASF